MNAHPEQDHDLETAHAALREQDARHAPSYRALRDAAVEEESRRMRGARTVWTVAAAAVLATIALTVVLVGGRSGGPADLAAEISMSRELSSWSAPTDAIWDLASLDIPDSVPGLDVGSGFVPDALGSGEWQTAAANSPARNESEVER